MVQALHKQLSFIIINLLMKVNLSFLVKLVSIIVTLVLVALEV